MTHKLLATSLMQMECSDDLSTLVFNMWLAFEIKSFACEMELSHDSQIVPKCEF